MAVPLLLAASVAAAGGSSSAAQMPAGQTTPPGAGPITEAYREPAGRMIGAALTDEEGWEKLTHLTTRIGHRLSGSSGLERAIAWADEAMRAEGLDVTLQPVMVPHWVRGEEYARVVAPVTRRLSILGLGNSVGTGGEPIEAPVVVVGSFEELERLGRSAVEGRIVLFAVEWEGYGRTVQYRSGGASAAARLGAVAALVRSATGNSLYTPHTGAMNYAEDAPRIPAAAVTVEDAAWMRRMAEAGETVTVRLYMEAEMLPDAQSYNVIAEIPGSEAPDEVVVMGGHYDSWDVGQGAHDDGAACIAAWHALTIIKRLGLVPRRTLRVVLWTNEENGLRGGNAYRDWVGDDVAKHVAAIEMDGGNERPVGYGVTVEGDGQERALGLARQIGALLDGVDGGLIEGGGGGADIGPLMRAGVPGLGFRTVGEHYFDWHHTDADTIDKIEKTDFRKAVAMLAVMGFVLADMPETLSGG
ncbi:MAG: M20/M25/M40 family metallo-hydrolase [Gemmatimonadota bacterium]|nr:M20/M25/M40 family metallo-hydrolase [Gemmatimonadota bacterium]